MKKLFDYIIRVKPLVSFDNLDFDDRAFFSALPDESNDGDTYIFQVVGENKENALDNFHFEIPIAVLEHFKIKIILMN